MVNLVSGPNLPTPKNSRVIRTHITKRPKTNSLPKQRYVTLTDHPSSVCNRCAVESLNGVFVLFPVLDSCPVGIGACIMRLGQVSSFFL